MVKYMENENKEREKPFEICFKNFRICKPSYFGRKPENYNELFNLEKETSYGTYFVVATMRIQDEENMEMTTCGTRFLELGEDELLYVSSVCLQFMKMVVSMKLYE